MKMTLTARQNLKRLENAKEQAEDVMAHFDSLPLAERRRINAGAVE